MKFEVTSELICGAELAKEPAKVFALQLLDFWKAKLKTDKLPTSFEIIRQTNRTYEAAVLRALYKLTGS